MQVSSPLGAPLAAVRHPRLRVVANGAVVSGAFMADVVNNSHYGADSFRLALVPSVDPLRGAAWWVEQEDMLVEVQMSLGSDYVTLLRGRVDSMELDPICNIVHLMGRDLAAGLIEARPQETFANQTSSEIAVALAVRHGLVADIERTTTPVGRYWELEHDSLVLGGFARATTEWDLLVTLAQIEGFDLWVRGSTLYFRRPEVGGPATVLRIAELTGLRLERALSFAGAIEVTVKSWHSRAARCHTQMASARTSSAAGGRKRSYVYIVPNLTPDLAQQLAQRRLAELARHERVVCAEMPGELALAPGQQILLQGSGTAFDRIYTVDMIERHFDCRSGFTQSLRACSVDLGG